MAKVEPADLIRFVKSISGTILRTGGRDLSFEVRLEDGQIIYIPAATGKPRRQSAKALEAVCRLFNETASTRPADYSSITAHNSYVLSLLDAYARSRGSEKRPADWKAIAGAAVAQAKSAERKPKETRVAPEADNERGKGNSKRRAEQLRTLKRLQEAARRSTGLLKAEYRDEDRSVDLNGFCYILTESMKRLYPNDFTVHRLGWQDGTSHWFLRDGDGRVFETISEGARECMTKQEYDEAKRRGLLTPTWGKRAKKLMDLAGIPLPE
jgi:hypothetical protein